MISRRICMAAAFSWFSAISMLTVMAQDPARARMQDQARRESELRNFGKTPVDKSDPKALKAAMDEVDLDFKRILTLHNDLARMTGSQQPIDLHFVADAASEIKKRASSLQTILELNRTNSTERDLARRPKIAGGEVKGAIVLLCKQIEIFLKNPVIAAPGTVDARQKEMAGQDLESIIDLSNNIKRAAERLGKSSL
ncbi:MAG TPA: hypothetical protein VEZ90_17355 [Blastocatellia bacterium]|nr:hypothetical protein [Blastocatellia bacterium]